VIKLYSLSPLFYQEIEIGLLPDSNESSIFGSFYLSMFIILKK